VETEGELDGFAGGAGGSNDNDPPGRVRGMSVGVGIRRKMMVAGRMHGGR
jgi:hypothetical protein